jgi:hypothetical protein
MTPNDIDTLLRYAQQSPQNDKTKKRNPVGQGIETIVKTIGKGGLSALNAIANVRPNYNIRTV